MGDSGYKAVPRRSRGSGRRLSKFVVYQESRVLAQHFWKVVKSLIVLTKISSQNILKECVICKTKTKKTGNIMIMIFFFQNPHLCYYLSFDVS